MAVSKLPHLKAIVDAYTNAHGSSDSWVSEQMGLSRQALSSWWNDGLSGMPSPYLILALARATRTPYRDVLDAALADFMYLPESLAETVPAPPRLNRKGKSAARAQAQAESETMTESQDTGGFDPA